MDTPEIKNVTVEEAANEYQKPGNCLLDVRNDDEVAELSVPGSIHIPLDRLLSEADKLREYSTIYVMCKGGVRSAKGTEILYKLGMTQAVNVLGGILAWQEAGFPTK